MSRARFGTPVSWEVVSSGVDSHVRRRATRAIIVVQVLAMGGGDPGEPGLAGGGVLSGTALHAMGPKS
ncbi:hypothetical protein [Streptomyces sp. Ac-502]|uniref:hypothetical protein n=1 Tax=Streptomyces sp. Ac-502 TaxID=3342801 RepID=UPI003862BA31